MDGQRVLILLATLFAAASVIDATVLPFEEQFLPAGYSPHGENGLASAHARNIISAYRARARAVTYVWLYTRGACRRGADCFCRR